MTNYLKTYVRRNRLYYRNYGIFHARMEVYFQKYKEFAFKLILNC